MKNKKKGAEKSNSKVKGKESSSNNSNNNSNDESNNKLSSSSSGNSNLYYAAFAAAVSVLLYSSSASFLEQTSLKPSSRSLQQELPKLLESNTFNAMPCTDENLAHFLHDIKVPGLHVICLNKATTNNGDNEEKAEEVCDDNLPLQVTIYPTAQKTSTPVTVELAAVNKQSSSSSSLPSWSQLRSQLIDSLKLRPTDRVKQPWSIFSSNGQWLVGEEEVEDEESSSSASDENENGQDKNVIMQLLLQSEILLLYEGGQFIWPGVAVGYQRNITLFDKDGSPSSQATLETLSLSPLVLSVKGFLTDEECTAIQTYAEPTIRYSDVVLMDKDQGRPASDFRTSQSTFLNSQKYKSLRTIDHRTSQLVRVPRSHQEHVQVLRYGFTEKYDSHHDYFDPKLYQNDPNTLRLIKHGRKNRMATVFWYLTDVAKGGETYFPQSKATLIDYKKKCPGLKVKPERGKVIIFYSLHPDGSIDPASLHGACPVEEGIKWAANKWVWNMPFSS